MVVPFTEDYYSRRELRQNAILADIVHPANLGRSPQQTVANALADRFGGYPTDFVVARHREHDFTVFLPEWASAERLVIKKTDYYFGGLLDELFRVGTISTYYSA